MKSRNIFNKMFIALVVIIIPLMITIGLAAWIMISEERIKPQYNPNSVFYIYLNGQNKDYTGGELLPDSNVEGAIDWDKGTITHECFRKNESGAYVKYTNKLGNSTPLDAGDYLIRYSDSDDDIALLGSDVNFTINKVNPTVSSWPTLNSMYWGNTQSFNTTSGSFSIVDGSFAFESGGSRASAELPYTVSLLYTPNDTTNYNTLTETVDVTLKAVANVGTTFYATVDEAITSTKSGTIYVMLTGEGSDKAKTIGATTSNKSITLATGVTLYIPYCMTENSGTYSYNEVRTNPLGVEIEIAREWGATNNHYNDDGAKYDNGEYINSIDFNKFADFDGGETYLKNIVYVENQKTFYISEDAKLVVSGVLGQPSGGNIQGHTSKDYTEIRLKPESSIVNDKGTIILGGFIKEVNDKNLYVNNYTSEVRIKDYSYIFMPFIFNDYRGGASVAGSYVAGVGAPASGAGIILGTEQINPNIMPFSRYDMPNIQTKLIIEYGGAVETYASLFTGAVFANIPDSLKWATGIIETIVEVKDNQIYIPPQHTVENITMLGSSERTTKSTPLFIMTTDSIVTIECKNFTPGCTINQPNTRKTYVSVETKTEDGEGGIIFNALNLTVTVLKKDITLDSSKVFFSIPDLFEFNIISGISYFTSDFKILPGGKVTVGEAATLYVQKNLSIYSSFYDNCGTSPYPRGDQLDFSSGKLIVNGKLFVQERGSIGGLVETTSENAEININATAGITVETKEGWGGMSGLDFVFYPASESPKLEKFKLYKYANNKVNVSPSNCYAGIYKSIKDTDGNYGWVQSQIIISFDPNHPDMGSDIYSFTKDTINPSGFLTGYTILSSDLQTLSKPSSLVHYEYVWSLDPTEHKDPVNFRTYESVTLYAIWSPIEYEITDITYIFIDDDGKVIADGVDNTSNPGLNYKFTVVSNNELVDPTLTNYNFGGWYTNFDSVNNVLSGGITHFVGANYINDDKTVKPIVLYGLFGQGKPINITYEFENAPSGLSVPASRNLFTSKIDDYNLPDTYDTYEDDPTKSAYISGWSYYYGNVSGSITDIDDFRDYLEKDVPAGSSVTIKATWTNKIAVSVIDYRIVKEEILATRPTIYLKPREYTFDELKNSTNKTIKATFTEKSSFGGLSYKFVGYGTSEDSSSSTNFKIEKGEEGIITIYMHYKLIVSVRVTSSICLGVNDLGWLGKYPYSLEQAITITFNETDSKTIFKVGLETGTNTETYNETFTYCEGDTFKFTESTTAKAKITSKNVTITYNGDKTIGSDPTQVITLKITVSD